MPNSSVKPEWDEDTYVLAQKFVSTFKFIRDEDREDVVHDFFLKKQNLAGFSGKSKWTTWFYACLFNFGFSWARNKYRLRWKNPPKHVPLIVQPKPDEDPEPRQIPQPDQPCPYTIYSLLDRWTRWSEYIQPISYIDEMWNPDWVESVRDIKGMGPEMLAVFPGLAEFRKELDEFSLHILQCEECIRRLDEFSKDPEKVYNSLSNYAYGGSMENVQEVLEMQKKLEEKKKIAIDELLKQQKEIADQLAQLGYKASNQSKQKGQRICSNCGESGHNIRRCPKPKKAGVKIKPKT